MHACKHSLDPFVRGSLYLMKFPLASQDHLASHRRLRLSPSNLKHTVPVTCMMPLERGVITRPNSVAIILGIQPWPRVFQSLQIRVLEWLFAEMPVANTWVKNKKIQGLKSIESRAVPPPSLPGPGQKACPLSPSIRSGPKVPIVHSTIVVSTRCVCEVYQACSDHRLQICRRSIFALRARCDNSERFFCFQQWKRG